MFVESKDAFLLFSWYTDRLGGSVSEKFVGEFCGDLIARFVAVVGEFPIPFAKSGSDAALDQGVDHEGDVVDEPEGLNAAWRLEEYGVDGCF